MTVLDPTLDTNGVELHRLAKLYDLPDFVKKADMAATLQPKDLPPVAYGDPRSNQWPLHTKAATFLSALYFAENGNAYHRKEAAMVQQRLDAAVDHWGLAGEVTTMRQKHAAYHQDLDSQLPDSDYAYVWASDDGQKHRHLRMKNAAEVKAAADWLARYVDALPYSDRNVIAGKILQKAAAYGATLGDSEMEIFVERQAGRGVCNPDDVVRMVRNRAKLATDATLRHGFEKLAHTIETKGMLALRPDNLVKLAETIDQLDRLCKLAGKYTDLIKRPEDVLFSCTYKEAKDAVGDAVPLVTGRVFDKKAFSRIRLNDLQDMMGQELANEVAEGLNVNTEKLAELAPTFPRPDAEAFESILADMGIPPLYAKAANDRWGLTDQAAQQLAASY